MTEHRFCPPRCGWVNLAVHAPPTSARILNSPHSSDRSHTVREMEPVLSAGAGGHWTPSQRYRLPERSVPSPRSRPLTIVLSTMASLADRRLSLHDQDGR